MDPVTMVNILMAVGFNVDYTAHFSYHFYKTVNLSKVERLYGTFSAVGFPMIQAAISTAICVLPLSFNTVYVFLAFVKTVVLVVVFGLIHGLIILPVTLSALPDYCTSGFCGSRRKNRHNEDAMEELQGRNAIGGRR
jgi:predicted RND superfamily exporter protein